MNCLLLLFVLPALTLAQLPPPDEMAWVLFRDADVNADGQLLRPEMNAYFNRFDTDGNGRVSGFEFDVYIATTYTYLEPYTAELFDSLDFTSDNVLDGTDYNILWSLLDGNLNDIVSSSEFVFYFSQLFAQLG